MTARSAAKAAREAERTWQPGVPVVFTVFMVPSQPFRNPNARGRMGYPVLVDLARYTDAPEGR